MVSGSITRHCGGWAPGYLSGFGMESETYLPATQWLSPRSTAWGFEGKAQTFLLFFQFLIKIKIKIVIQRQTKGCKQGKGQRGARGEKGHGGGAG